MAIKSALSATPKRRQAEAPLPIPELSLKALMTVADMLPTLSINSPPKVEPPRYPGTLAMIAHRPRRCMYRTLYIYIHCLYRVYVGH